MLNSVIAIARVAVKPGMAPIKIPAPVPINMATILLSIRAWGKPESTSSITLAPKDELRWKRMRKYQMKNNIGQNIKQHPAYHNMQPTALPAQISHGRNKPECRSQKTNTASQPDKGCQKQQPGQPLFKRSLIRSAGLLMMSQQGKKGKYDQSTAHCIRIVSALGHLPCSVPNNDGAQ